ncbi:VOC family protein [Streptomyces sp. NPDC048248]|uniref:VOC family protein n=1 Tax=Streptomyces sp. NPDC048248 TaxID=3365523 RepID=UPI003711D245
MSEVTTNQPYGTPTWIDLGVADLERAKAFYGALFGWTYEERSSATGPFTMCLLRGRRVAAFRPRSAADPDGESWWHMYVAAEDCDAAAERITARGGSVLQQPQDVGALCRTAVVEDPVGARFGLWQGRALAGCEFVNEPGTLVRNDLATPDPEPARRFYADTFDFTLDGNKDLPDFDFTFLRRPDGHEIGGVFGDPGAAASRWRTTFEVDGTDEAAERAVAAGGTASEPTDAPYGRMADITDPFGTAFGVITRPPAVRAVGEGE